MFMSAFREDSDQIRTRSESSTAVLFECNRSKETLEVLVLFGLLFFLFSFQNADQGFKTVLSCLDMTESTFFFLSTAGLWGMHHVGKFHVANLNRFSVRGLKRWNVTECRFVKRKEGWRQSILQFNVSANMFNFLARKTKNFLNVFCCVFSNQLLISTARFKP